MNAHTKVRALLLVSSMHVLTGISALAEEPPHPAAFQALLTKHRIEKIDELIDACTTFTNKKKTLTSDDRKELLAVALEEKLRDSEREKLMMLLYVTLRDAETRAPEAIDLTPQLEKFQTQKFVGNARHLSFACQAFSLEHQDGGRERELAWFRRIGQSTGEDRIAMLVALSLTKCADHKQRFKLLREVYEDKHSDEATRLTIADVIFQATIYGGLPLDKCILHFRDLSKLTETTPAVNTRMFSHLAAFVHMAKILGKIDSTSKK